MTEIAQHTPLPWRLDFTKGRKSKKGEYVPEDCEDYNLAQAKIVAPSVPTSAKSYNSKTKQFDVSVPLEITEIVFDDRPAKYNRPAEHLANAAFIVTAVNNHYGLLDAARAAANKPCSTESAEDLEPGCCESCRARAALAKAEAK
jgi:hypothetical protein